jgi:3-ketosteroid 9alpha-monooxygenase subunit B
MKSAHTLQIAKVLPQGRDAVLLSFVAEDGGAPNLSFRPGQYLTLGADVSGGEHWRSYSITSEPSADESINVLVRRVAGGVVSNWICDNVRVGQQMRVLPPAGRFTLALSKEPVLLFAGGSGIAPIFALARQALAEGAPKVSLFYANRDRATAMLIEELAALSKIARDRFLIRFWFDDRDGIPTQENLRSATEGFEDAHVYLCGPEPFMRAIQACLPEAGFDPACVHQEDFGAPEEDESTLDAELAREALLTVKIKGKIHEIVINGRGSLLSAMLKAGLQVPHSCKVGECASCICRLREGDVERLENSVLDADDTSQGWIVACRTRALSKTLRVDFS